MEFGAWASTGKGGGLHRHCALHAVGDLREPDGNCQGRDPRHLRHTAKRFCARAPVACIAVGILFPSPHYSRADASALSQVGEIRTVTETSLRFPSMV